MDELKECNRNPVFIASIDSEKHDKIELVVITNVCDNCIIKILEQHILKLKKQKPIKTK